MSIHRVFILILEIILGLYGLYIQVCHHFYNTCSNLTGAGDSNFHYRQLYFFVGSYQCLVIRYLMSSREMIKTMLLAIGKQAVVRAYYTRKKPEAQYTLRIAVRKTFIIYHADLLLYQRVHQLLVIGLFLFCMRKEKIGFTRDKSIYRNLLYTQQHIANAHIIAELDTCLGIFLIFIATGR